MRDRFEKPISTLARRIVSHDVIGLELQGQVWLPMFQFDPSDMQVRPAVRAAIHELRGVFDEWGLARWFALPNSSLCGQFPASQVLCNERVVLEAAMVDRYVAAGRTAHVRARFGRQPRHRDAIGGMHLLHFPAFRQRTTASNIE